MRFGAAQRIFGLPSDTVEKIFNPARPIPPLWLTAKKPIIIITPGGLKKALRSKEALQ